MSYAILFPGQGSQHPDMLPWLPSAASGSAALQAMEAELGPDWRPTLQSDALRSQNAFAQTVITGTALAAWDLLQPHLPQRPAVVAGYSVGEMAAFACAGALGPAQAVALARQRALCMDQAAGGVAAGLLSVSGLTLQEVARHFPGLHCAIRIATDHALWGGLSAELEQAQAQLSQVGASCKRLPIALASHTPQMAEASLAFAQVLQAEPMQVPSVPLVPNATARRSQRVADLRQALSVQISTTVDWAACMQAVAESGVRCVLEVGAGHALAELWNRQHPDIPARSLEDFQDPRGAAQWVARQMA